MARLAPLALAVLALLSGCYRTNERREPDAGPPVPDAWTPPPPDAWAPDAWAPDASFPPSECARDRDCAGAICVHDLSRPPRDLEAVPLRCASPVGALPTGAECDSNAACDHGICALAGGCVTPCLDASDCGAGERCTRVPVVTSATSLQFASGCVRWVDPPPGVTVTASEDLVVPTFSTVDLTIEPMIAPRRLVLYVAEAIDDERYVSQMTTGTGEVVFDAFGLGSERQRLLVAPFGALIPVLVPNGDEDFPVGTSFVARLETGRTSALRRVVMDRASAGTTLDLNFFYVGVEPPRGGVPPASVVEMLRQLAALYETVGLRLGRHRHYPVPGATARRFEVVEEDAEVQELFTYSAGAARPAVNVFLIRSSTTFLGIAGGVPGAELVHGTRSSGLAIAFEDLESYVDMGAPAGILGTVIGHEVGHFLGFAHTTEADGASYEPLSDTPQCSLAQDTDGDGMLLPFECEGFGNDNVMFWAPFDEGPRFSPRQGTILRNAMVLQ